MVVRNGVKSEKKMKIRVRPPAKQRKRYKTPGYREAPRLVVQIKHRQEYLHRMCAYAFHRKKYANNVKDYKEFKRKKFQGDHLCDYALNTKPEWCIAGWIEAVPAHVHKERTKELKEGRIADEVCNEIYDEEVAMEFEMQEVYEAAEVASANLDKALASLAKKSNGDLDARRLDLWARLCEKKANAEEILEAQSRPTYFEALCNSELEFDIDVRTKEGGGPGRNPLQKPGDANPFIKQFLFVDSELPPRRALLARCYRIVNQQRGRVKKYVTKPFLKKEIKRLTAPLAPHPCVAELEKMKAELREKAVEKYGSKYKPLRF